MSGVGGTKIPQLQATDEQSSNEYPTLKLSLSPTNPPKETTRLEKTAPTAVVKPERVKRSSTPKEHDASPTGDTCTLSKFQKFGVRVLPDPAPRQTTENKPATIEAEKHQNEQNLIKERVATNPFSEPHGQDTVDIEAQSDVSLHYDERGIDVGPVEMHRNSSPPDNILVEKHQRSVSNDEEDGHKEHNVKNLLTKGLQNLKEKLHHDKKGTGSPESPQRCKDKKQKPVRHHKTSMSSDSEGFDGDRSVEGTIKSKFNSREEPEKMERKRQRNPEKDNQTDVILPPSGSDIPTEIPEEVRRAAVAARSNRRSLQVPTPITVVHEIKEKDSPPSSPPAKESISDSSSDEGGTDTNTDSSGRPPKRSNKRKAPPPPAEEGEHNLTNSSFNVSNIEGDQNTSVSKENETQPRESNAQPTVGWSKVKNIIPENRPNKTSGENETVIPTFNNLPQQKNNSESSGKDVTNITIDDGHSNILSSLTTRTVDSDNAGQVHVFPVDSSSSGTSTMETKTVDYDESIHISTVNSDSDSDLERLEGDDEEYDRKRGKKGGTTIELNSSHITIHHSPSSDTMQMAVELESDSTRKAASLGDLSRLDSEQPMSILERAVSLDLGDGGTPHSSKKRKAPLPPPGEEYLGVIQDADDSAQYRKEPRLDNAMDTFQRRRLKKSSDWGTLEEAIKQTDTSSVPSKITNTDTSQVEMAVSKSNDTLIMSHDGIPSEIPNLADDQKVKLSGLSQKFSDVVRAEAINISGIEPLDSPQCANQHDVSDNAEESGRSSPECDHTLVEQDDLESRPSADVESTQQKKTVLHISPEPTKKSLEVNMSNEDTSPVLPSQVTIASTSLLGLRRAISEPASHEVTLTTSSEQNHPAISPRLRPGKIISSTPLPNRERALVSHISPSSQTSATEQSYIRESLQSPLVTSSDAGISNINVVSSTTQDTSSSSDMDSNIMVSSATDHFVTAASFVDSTSAAEEISDNEDIWENDLQPPELPTSPVPVLTQASSSSSSFPTSPSMTYITEIQVVTTTDSDNDQTIGSSNMEVTHNGTHVSSSFTQKGLINQVDASHSPELTGNGNIELISDNESSTYLTENNSLVSLPRSNVIVTSIRSSESTSGQSGGIVTETTNNHLSEKKPKSARPPVPPRKSDLSSQCSPPSMSSSTIMVEVPKIRLTETASSSLLAGGSLSQINPAAAGKFISFSSLSPRAEGSSTRHGSSFEQWVFLDDTAPSGHHNGFETNVTNTENGQHASVMTLPGLSPNRSQTVTHIILDTKQNSGGQIQE